jgi:hypothetical protein
MSAVYSYGQSIGDLSITFIISMGILLALSPFYKSKKSFFDALAARKVIFILRILIILEMIMNCILLYMYTYKGEPILSIHALSVYSNENSSWIYGFGRPICGLIFISMGTVSDMHATARLLCMAGCFEQIACDAISAIQIQDLLFQITYFSVQPTNYSVYWLHVYYYRDIISFGVSLYILMMCVYFTSIVGWYEPQYISYRVVSGGDVDRCQVMRDHRDSRMLNLSQQSSGQEKKQKNKTYHLFAEEVDKDKVGLDEDDLPI